MNDPATVFAAQYDSRFRSLTSGYTHAEIPLFRAMHNALVTLGSQFEIEEYHGTSHQVTFTGNGSYARKYARCELSDLMIITFSPITKDVRLTYLQAKSERAPIHPTRRHPISANLEQWFLLSSRPAISGIGSFKPPPDLLSNSILPSVGTFAFFYKDGAGEFQTYFATANYLSPPRTYSQKNGKLQALGPCAVVNNSGYSECLAAYGNIAFAKSLYRLEIGTPVDGTVAQAFQTRNWLAANLKKQIQATLTAAEEQSTTLAQELLVLLDPEEEQAGSGSFGAKNLIIIKSEVDPDKHTNSDEL